MLGLQNYLKEAWIAYVEGKTHSAITFYKKALEYIISNDIQEDAADKNIIKYMISLTTLETKNMDDINNAILTLTELKKSIGSVFPAVYYALGKANYNQYRFEEANFVIEEGLAILNGHTDLKRYYVPGTKIILPESTKSGLFEVLQQLREKCLGWHRPDAVCSNPNCLNLMTDSTPNRKIFFGDPNFNGMVRITCNNSTNPCEINFHQICWKAVKEELSPIKKLSDKDVIGRTCFTPNCENNSIRSIIIKIKIIDENADVKTVIEGPAIVQPVKHIPVTKGAIRKQIIQPKEKKRFERPKKPPLIAQQLQSSKETPNDYRSDLEWRLLQLIDNRENNFYIPADENWRPDMEMYGNLNLLMTLNAFPDPDFSDSESEIAKLQNFTFSMLYEYIVNSGPVKVDDVLLKWEETKNFIPSSVTVINNDIEIIDFLLQSYKVAMIGEFICALEILPNVYHLVKQNTNGCFNFALENALDPEDLDLEDDDDDNFYNQIMQEEGDENSILVEPKQEAKYNKNLHQTKCVDDADLVLDFEIEAHVKNTVNSEYTGKKINNQYSPRFQEAEQFTLSQSKVFNSLDMLLSEKDLHKNKLIDEVSFSMKNCFLDFEKQLARKRKGDDDLLSKSKLKESEDVPEDVLYDTSTDYGELERNATTHRETEFQESKTMENAVYKRYVDHVTLLSEQIHKISNEKASAEQRINQLLQENRIINKKAEEKQKSMMEKIDNYKSLVSLSKDIQKRYESQIDDNSKLQEELFAILKDKQDLESKLDTCLKENSKLAADLQKERELALERNKSLLLNLLTAQFTANKYYLNGHIEQCNLSLNVFSAVNAYLRNFINVPLFPESNEWMNALNQLQMLLNIHQIEFSKQRELLQSRDEENAKNDINLKVPEIPARPALPLAESVQRAFNVFYMHIMNTMPRVPNMPPPPPPPAMIHPTMNQPRYTQNQTVYLMNPGYQFPRNRVNYTPQQPVFPQPLMGLNFPRPTMLPTTQTNNDLNKLSTSVSNTEITVNNEHERMEENVLKEDSENTSSDEIELEEKDKNSEASSSKGSTSSLFKKSEDAPTSPLNGLTTKQPKFGFDRVIEKLRSEFIGIPEHDLIECVLDIRKMHNNSLNGLKTLEIIKEARQFILKRQKKYICDYTDKTNSTTHKEEHLKHTESTNKDKPMENKDVFHPFAFERLSALRNRNNSVSSTSSAGSVPVKTEVQPAKKTSMKPAWILKTSDNNWTKETQEAECIICTDPLDNVGRKKAVYTLKCQHSFHTECIRNWFKISQSCPNCREYATHDEDFPPLP